MKKKCLNTFKPILLNIPAEMLPDLDALAEVKRLPRTQVIRQAIAAHLLEQRNFKEQ